MCRCLWERYSGGQFINRKVRVFCYSLFHFFFHVLDTRCSRPLITFFQINGIVHVKTVDNTFYGGLCSVQAFPNVWNCSKCWVILSRNSVPVQNKLLCRMPSLHQCTSFCTVWTCPTMSSIAPMQLIGYTSALPSRYFKIPPSFFSSCMRTQEHESIWTSKLPVE